MLRGPHAPRAAAMRLVRRALCAHEKEARADYAMICRFQSFAMARCCFWAIFLRLAILGEMRITLFARTRLMFHHKIARSSLSYDIFRYSTLLAYIGDISKYSEDAQHNTYVRAMMELFYGALAMMAFSGLEVKPIKCSYKVSMMRALHVLI